MRGKCTVLMLIMAAPGVLAAQRPTYDEANIVQYPAPHFFVDLSLDVGQATGEFANYVDAGVGLSGTMRFRPNANGPFAVRAGGTFLIYGSTTSRYPLVPGIGVDVTTSNQIAGFTIGPELNFGTGGLQPYVFGGIGFSYFATVSSVEGTGNSGSPFASTTNFDDFTFASEGGGGLRVRVANGRTPVWIDLGARYLNNGLVTYVTKEGVSVANNQLILSPVISEANLVVYRLGVSLGLRSRNNSVRVGN